MNYDLQAKAKPARISVEHNQNSRQAVKEKVKPSNGAKDPKGLSLADRLSTKCGRQP